MITSLVVLEPSTTVAAGATVTTVAPKRPIRAGRITRIIPVVIDPAYSTPSVQANQYALLDRIGVRISVRGAPISGTEDSDYIPMSALLGSRENPVEWGIPVDENTVLRAEFKSLDSSGAPALAPRLIFHIEQ